jgi:Protein of unknown function (DUF1593)
VLTDIGGDPDDRQSMIRLMIYANEFEIEGLIASAAGTPGELKKAMVRPDLIKEIVQAYGKVRPRLVRHAEGWPEAAGLTAKIKSGNPRRGRDHIGEAHDTEGSRWLVERIDAGTADNPLNIAIWGGQTDLAQALWQVKTTRGETGLAEFVPRFRVYDIADQDGLATWMRGEFPGMFYILNKAHEGRDGREAVFRGMYLGGNEYLTSESWIELNIRNKGYLGALYPIKTHTAPNPHGCQKEGDTPSWFFFLPAGGNDPADPAKPGWGGQFVKEADGWYRDPPFSKEEDPRVSVSRWRPDFQADFAKRMAWCLKE